MSITKTSQGNLLPLQQAIADLTKKVKIESNRRYDCMKKTKSWLLKKDRPAGTVEVENGVGLRRSVYWASENDARAGSTTLVFFALDNPNLQLNPTRTLIAMFVQRCS